MRCLADVIQICYVNAMQKQGEGRVLFSPTHKLKRTPGGSADGTVADSGVMGRFKLLSSRKRLAQEHGGRRMVSKILENFVNK